MRLPRLMVLALLFCLFSLGNPCEAQLFGRRAGCSGGACASSPSQSFQSVADCPGGVCYPQASRSFQEYPSLSAGEISHSGLRSYPVSATAERVEPAATYGWHSTTYNGVRLQVWGCKTQAGNIRWDTALPTNAKQYAAALAERDKADQEQPPAPLPRKYPWKPEYDEQAKVSATVRVIPASQRVEQAAPSSSTHTPFQGVDPRKLFKAPVGSERYDSNDIKAAESFMGYQATPPVVGGGEDYLAKNPKLYVSVIGPDELTNPISADWKANSEFNQFKDEVYFKTYSPKTWQAKVASAGNQPGKPLILIHDAESGRLLYRGLDYSGGASQLSNEIMKCHPRFDHRSVWERFWANSVLGAFEFKYGENLIGWLLAIIVVLGVTLVVRKK